jgi:HNH endonuclease
MSITYVGVSLRQLVETRANGLCEYCLIAEEDTCLGCEVDHVISEKHGGATDEDNLAMACVFCNKAKGSDIGSIIWESGAFVRFFNPRTDRWSEHFCLKDYRIEPLTDIGTVTGRILQFNIVERLLERQALTVVNRFPSDAALKRIDE